jgi:hypothetical protein
VGAEVGELIVGLRSNDDELVDALRRVLAPIRADDQAVFPNLSLYVGEGGGHVRELHRLYRRGTTVLRTASVGRLLRAALKHLDAFLPPPPGLVPLRGDLLVGAGGALLANEPFTRMEVPERRIWKLGWRGTDGAAAFLDVTASEVVVAEPRLTFDAAGLAEIDARWVPLESEEGVTAGRYPIRAVVLLGTGPDHLLTSSPACRRADLASLIDTSILPPRATDVEALGALDGGIELVRILGNDTRELVGVLRDLAA